MLISFDGLDSSGKATQVQQLISRLEKLGHIVHHHETPDYSTPSGQELRERLQGKLGDWENTPWREKAGYFAQNRAEHKAEVLEALAKGEVVVYDRYIPSSLAFVTVEAFAEDTEKHNRADVQGWVQELEYKKNGMPVEDVSIFLDMPPHLADKLLDKRKEVQQEEDEYTDRLSVQEGLYKEYEILTDADPKRYWRINCVTTLGALRSIAEISEEIWERIAPQL